MATKEAYAAVNPANTTVPVNPVTKQPEAYDPNVAINTGKYSVENKRALAEASGLDPSKVPMDAYYRAAGPDGTGTLAIKPGVVADPAAQYDEAGYVRKINTIGAQFGQAYQDNKYSDIVGRIKAKTGGVADIDAKLTELQYNRNKLRPQLLAKYASVIDPVKREALISQEEQAVDSQIANLTGVREKRAGTINEMIAAEVKDKENMLQALAKQYDVAKNALGDLRSAEKTKKEMERLNLEIEADRLKLDQAKATAPYAIDNARLDTASKYKTLYGSAPTTGGMRTDRHNNPTAFTTDIARQAGLVEGVDYTVGDEFGGGKYHTANITGDPIATTIKVIDKIGFKTQSGADRWTYTGKLGLNNETWAKMDASQKAEAIKKMYQQEGGSGALFNGSSATNSEIERYLTNSSFTEDEKKKIRQDASANGLSIDKVKELYPQKTSSSSTSDDVEKSVKELIDAPGTVSVQDAVAQVLKKHPKAKESDVRKIIENLDPETKKDFLVADIQTGSVRLDGKNYTVNVKNVKTVVDYLIGEYGPEEAKDILDESGLLKKKGFRPGVWDDDGYDIIQQAFSDADYDI